MDKSFRIYNASKRSVRERKNVIFIETPSVLPEPDLVSGVDEGEITYDVYDDMVQDVRNYISNLDLASPPAADGVVGDPSVRDRLEQIRATITLDLGLNPASSVPSEHSPAGHSPIASPGGVSPASPEGGNPSGTGGTSDSHCSSGGGTSSSSASRGGRTSRGGRGSRGGAASRGERGATTSQRPATRSTANQPSARTMSELRRLAFYTKGLLARAMSKPSKVHMGAAKHILRYWLEPPILPSSTSREVSSSQPSQTPTGATTPTTANQRRATS